MRTTTSPSGTLAIVDRARLSKRMSRALRHDPARYGLEPPDVLFHGTDGPAAAAIAEEGLIPMGRQFVHLSPAEDTARRVWARHGRPVVFVVDARAAAREGVVFRRGNDDTWLTDSLDARFLSRATSAPFRGRPGSGPPTV